MKQGFEKTAAGIRSLTEALLQLIAQGREFIDFSDDAVLLSEGWQRYWKVSQDAWS